MKMLMVAFLFLFLGVAQATDVTVTWTNPTTNTDGSSIPATGPGSLTGTRVEHGTCVGAAFGTANGEVTAAAGATSVVITGLAPATHCVRAFARNTYGTESAASNVFVKAISPPVPNPPTIVTVATVARLYLKDLSFRVGSIALGEACKDQKAGDWYSVDRRDVKLSFIGRMFTNSKSTIVARCAEA